MIGLATTTTGWGQGPLAAQQLGEMIWKCIELGAWLFIGGVVVYFAARAFRL